jgi:multidrug transporter EmrE-like cation transporter
MRNYDISLLSVYSYAFWSIGALWYMLYDGFDFSNFILIAIMSTINVVFYFSSILTRVESMKNIDSVIFFPIFKTIGPIFITGLSFFYFWESLSLKEIIGIIIGISVPLLLISAHENKRQIYMKRWIIFLVITVLLTLVSTSMLKQMQIQNLNVPLFVFLTSLIGVPVSYIKYKYSSKKIWWQKYKTKWLLAFSFWVGLLHLLSFVTFLLALTGNLAVVFTINSFWILIPIVLSIIFYKDHFNLKKAIVIALSIISILLFL